MRFRQIEAFRATILTGTITGAAEYLGITQPSASRLVADLESNLGFKLFDRSAGRLQSTPEGIRFYSDVEKSFVGLEKLELSADRIRNQLTGDLHISCTPSLSASLVPGVIELFLKKRPQVMIDLVVQLPADIFGSLQSQSTDVSLGFPLPVSSGIKQEPLVDVDYVAAIPEGHPLAKKKVLKITDFHDEHFISLSAAGPVNWAQIGKEFQLANVVPKSRIFTQQAYTAYSLVAKGLGLSIIEPFSAHPWINSGVVVRPLRPSIQLNYTLGFPAHKVQSLLTQEFVETIKEYLQLHSPYSFH